MKINKPHEAPADYMMYHIHRKRKDYFLLSTPSSLFHQHRGQINYLPSIKGAIIFQPPSYANESTLGWGRKLVMSTKWGWQEIYSTSQNTAYERQECHFEAKR